MLQVDHYDLIRQKIRGGMSQRQVARELGHSHNTVAKAVKYNIPPGYRMSRDRSKPSIEAVANIIEQWVKITRRPIPSSDRPPGRFTSDYVMNAISLVITPLSSGM